MSNRYDRIGQGYNRTRKADPYLLSRMHTLLVTDPGGKYLDIGCGTGNYTIELQRMGLDIAGLDPSATMLEVARDRMPDVEWIRAEAGRSGFASGSFDGILTSLTIHHWDDLEAGFREMGRLLKPGGRLVVFTSDPDQMRGYWLNHYFPGMMERSIEQMPSLKEVEGALQVARIEIAKKEPYFIRDDHEDLFLYSGKHRPELYYDPAVRQGISSFTILAEEEEIMDGLLRLRNDLDTGTFDEIRRSYLNDDGDYLFVVGEKRDPVQAKT